MRTKDESRCPGCQALIGDPSSEICPFCWADLPRPHTDALDRLTIQYSTLTGRGVGRKKGEDVAAPPRRILPLLGLDDREAIAKQRAAQDDLHDFALLVERRRTARFMVMLYQKPGRDPRKSARAELWELMPGVEPDVRSLGVWRLIRTVPADHTHELEAEAERLNGGRPLDRWELHRVNASVETRGRPRKHLSEFERDEAAYYARTVTREYIREKYSKHRRCVVCRTFLPNTWPRKECSPRCTQQAYLRRKEKKSRSR